MDKLSDMRAVSHDQANKLAAIGISTAAQLLKAGATPEGRRDLVERTGIDKDHILSFVNYSDLCRIKGRLGDSTAHGGTIVLGEFTVLIG